MANKVVGPPVGAIAGDAAAVPGLAEILALLREVREEQASQARTIQGLGSTVVDLGASVKVVDASVNSLRSSVGSLRDTVDTMSTGVSELQGGLSSLGQDVGSVRGDLTTLKGDLAALKGDVAALQDELSGVEETVSELEVRERARTEGIDSYNAALFSGEMARVPRFRPAAAGQGFGGAPPRSRRVPLVRGTQD